MLKKSPALCLAVTVAAYFALWLLVPRATFLPAILNHVTSAMRHSHGATAVALAVLAAVLVSIPTIAFMVIQIAIVFFYARLKWGPVRSAIALVVCLAGVAGIMAIIVAQSGLPAKMHRSLTLRETLYVTSVFPSFLKMPMSVLIMLAAASLGCLISVRIKDRNLLLPVVLFAAWIDLWTVTKGPVAQMLRNAPEVAQAVSAPIPKAGTGAFVPETMVGPGDFLFLGLVFAAVVRLGMNDRRNYWFVAVAMTLGMLAVMFGILEHLPALVVLAAAVVVANVREFRLSKQEAVSIAIVAAVLAASLPLVWWVLAPAPKTENKRPNVENRKHLSPNPSPGKRREKERSSPAKESEHGTSPLTTGGQMGAGRK